MDKIMSKLKKNLERFRLYFVGIITIGIWSLLLWDHYHGGVPSHHLLHQKDLPVISNWWGGLLLPLLAIFLTYRIKQRIVKNSNDRPNTTTLPPQVIFGFILSLLYGILLSTSFILGYLNLAGYLTYGLLLLALFFPIYQSEYLLGFVVGMTYTFGAVLPTIVGMIFVLVGFALYRYVRTGIIFIIRKIISFVSPN